MLTVGAFEAKTRLAALLDAVERGEEVVITRHGKPVARLTGVDDTARRARAEEAVRHLRELRKGLTLGGITVQELRDEGRR